MVSHGSIEGGVRAHARARPEAPALLAPGHEPCTYAALAAHLDAACARLRALLPAANRVIAVVVSDGADACTALVAALTAGVCAPFDPANPTDELDAFLAHVRPALALTDDAGFARHGRSFAQYGVRVVRITPPPGRAAGVFDLRAMPCADAPGEALIAPGADVALLMRTSGSTSEPRVVPHAMVRLMHMIDAVAERLGMHPDDRCLNARPLYHIHAIVHVLGSSLVSGASIAFLPDAGAAALVDGWQTWRPTWYSASPPVHRDVLAVLRARSASPPHTLRFVRSSAAALDADLAIELEAALGVPVLEGYGTTEAPSMTLNPPPPHAHKPGSVGPAIGCEIRIADGHVAVRGANVAPAYAARGNAQPIVDPQSGWYNTGDLGTLDADGYVFITGRSNELINVGGVKIAPEAVERVLRDHPAIADALAFAMPHPTLGFYVAAMVVIRSGSTLDVDGVTDHAARVLSRHAVPNVLWPVRTIARDANGKVRRRDAAAGLARALEAARRAPGRVRGETDALRHALVRMWEEILERAPIALDENFFAAGGDSLRSVRLLARIAASLGVALPANALLTAPTIDALADVILAAAARDQPSRLIALRAHGSRPPLFFFDGDVNGGGLYSRFLLETLHPEQPVYVIRPAGLADDDVPSIETMADGDAALIAHAVPSAVYRLAGYCNGGAIAFEAARRLEASGAAVDVVALIGSSAPNARLDALWRLTAANARRYRFARRIAHRLRGGSPIAQLPGIVRGIAGTARAAGYRSTPVFRTYEDRLLRYFPQPYDRTVDIIWADDDYLRLPGDATMGWGRVARVRRRSMRGDHTTMLTDHVAELGAALRAIVDEADALRDPPARPPDTGA